MNVEPVQRVWSRGLPGGGFTAIDVTAEQDAALGTFYHGSLIVERRSEPRRLGHTPPVVAEATGATLNSIINTLLMTGESNAALGAALLRRQHAGHVS